MQKSEDRLDNIEAKIDILSMWITELRVNKGSPKAKNGQYATLLSPMVACAMEQDACIGTSRAFEEHEIVSLQQGATNGQSEQFITRVRVRISTASVEEDQDWSDAS